LKTVAAFSTPAEAHVAIARLAGSGVAAVMRDECTVQFNWLISNAVGGVKIEVEDDDFATTQEILALPPIESGILRCPHCGSFDTRVKVLSAFGALCMVLKLPIPQRLAAVDCRACGKTHDVPLDGTGCTGD